jgi:hypothetical protein
MIAVPLARAFGRSRRLLAFSQFARSLPIRSDALRTLSFLVALKEGRFLQQTSSKPQSRHRQTSHPDRRQHSASALARTLGRKWRLGGTLIAFCPDRNRERARSAFHPIVKDSRFLRRGARPVMLDKAASDMVPLRLNLRPPKENEAIRDNNSSAFID